MLKALLSLCVLAIPAQAMDDMDKSHTSDPRLMRETTQSMFEVDDADDAHLLGKDAHLSGKKAPLPEQKEEDIDATKFAKQFPITEEFVPSDEGHNRERQEAIFKRMRRNDRITYKGDDKENSLRTDSGRASPVTNPNDLTFVALPALAQGPWSEQLRTPIVVPQVNAESQMTRWDSYALPPSWKRHDRLLQAEIARMKAYNPKEHPNT